MTGKCTQCAAALPSDARFCPACGHAVETADDTERHRILSAQAPAPLAEKLRGAPVSGERKPVTALFADVVGSTALAESLDPEDWTAIINRAFELIAQAAYRYEGTVASLMGDGLLAFFGAPVAHEDDPERAVRAGRDMLASVAELAADLHDAYGIDFSIRVGINTGPVVVGNVGSDLRYEYTALGDAVNVAARVQQAAPPRGLLVTENTRRLIGDAFDLRDAGSLELKGKAEPVRAYEVVGAGSGPPRPRGIPGLESAMVGREAHLRRLADLVDALEAGRGGAALVIGEPGIGKTRLLAELRTLATAEGRDVVWKEAHCVSYGGELPYHLLVDLVRSILGVATSADDGAVGVAVERAAQEAGRDAAIFLSHLLSLHLDEESAERLSRLAPESLHAGYISSVRGLLRAAAATSPLVVVCEDVHWADAASAETLKTLLPLVNEVPALLVSTSRPDRDTAGWQLVNAARDAFGPALAEVQLAPLSDAESAELVGRLLEVESLPSRVRRALLAKAEGNPFFVEELIRMLIDRGAIVRHGSTWTATAEAAALEIPETLHGLLLARIDRLSDDARRALRIASVIGRRFTADLLEAVADAASGSLLSAVAALEASGLVALASARPELTYEFRHVLVQDAAYESLLKRERRRLHRAVGEALERADRVERSELVGILAFHFEQAGESERAIEYLVEAGERALARFANREARRFLDRAAAYLADAGDDEATRRRRVEVGIDRLEAGFTFVPFDDELELLEQLIPEAEALADPRLEARLHVLVARRHMQGELTDRVQQSLERALELAGELADERLRAQALALLGSWKHQAAQYGKAATLFEETVPLLERHGLLGQASYFAGLLAVARARLGEFATADRWLARAGDAAERSGDPNAELDHDILRGMVESERGNAVEAIEHARRGAERAGLVGNTICELAGSYVVGEQQLRQGRPEHAIPALERSSELAEFCDAGALANLSRAWLATARARLGDLETALPGFEAALAEARRMGDRFGEAEILRQRADALATARTPDWEAVLEGFGEAGAIFERLGARPALARTLRDHGLALQAAGRPEQAAETLRRAVALSDEMEISAETTHTAAAHG